MGGFLSPSGPSMNRGGGDGCFWLFVGLIVVFCVALILGAVLA